MLRVLTQEESKERDDATWLLLQPGIKFSYYLIEEQGPFTLKVHQCIVSQRLESLVEVIVLDATLLEGIIRKKYLSRDEVHCLNLI